MAEISPLRRRMLEDMRSSYPELSARGQASRAMVGRYTHAHQFKRARRELKFRTRLGRITRYTFVARSRAT
jgi:transposase, IS5 family